MRALSFVVSVLALATAYDPIPYPSCEADEYFDISSLNCNSCPEGQKPDASGLSCQCSGGVLRESTEADSAGVWECFSCAAVGMAPSRDGTACMPCRNYSVAVMQTVVLSEDNGTTTSTAEVLVNQTLEGGTLGLDADTGECACADSLAIMEYDGLGNLLPEKMCFGCPPATKLNSDGVCEACPAENMGTELVENSAFDSGFEMICVCLDGYETRTHRDGWWGRDVSCVQQAAYTEIATFDTAAADTVTYRDLVGGGTASVDSKLFAQLLIPSATDCLIAVQASETQPRKQPLLAGNEACQALGNLCVLQMYDEETEACELYREMQEVSEVEVNEEAEWKARLPALYYTTGPSVYTLNDVPLEVALEGDGARLTYVLSSYALNGSYLGLHELGDELQLCTGVAKDPNAYLTFGTGLLVQCELQLANLLAVTEPTFHDLYLKVDDNQLYPVPIKLANLRVNGRQVNVNSDSLSSQSNDQLVRRFFTVDAASGVELGDSLPQVLRYVKSARLVVTIVLYTPSNIFPPLVELEYAEVAVPSAETALKAEEALSEGVRDALTSSFQAKYTMELDRTVYIITILFVIALVLAVLGWFLQLYLWTRRNQRQVIDAAFLLKAASQLCRVFADVFFWLIFGSCGWLYCLFKNQDDVFVMMPLRSSLYPFQVALACTFGAKVVHVLDLVVSQAGHDVFFVDWEQPRGHQGSGAARGGDKDEDKDKETVSVWRSVFVANEWVRLQTARKVSLEFNLLFLLFLLRGLDQEYFATEIPNAIGYDGITPDPLLRFALSSFMLLIMSLCQALFRWALWDRFVEDRVWQFVDLLAVTNISCLLMEERYFGHYLHGRSVHAHADTDMLELNRNLKREQDQLCAKRGLQPDSEIQTFQVYLSRGVRERYDSIYEAGRSRLPGPRGKDGKGRPRGFRAGPEEALHRQQEVNSFLTSFISGNLEQHRLDIRPKLYFERLLGMPPELTYNTTTSVFLEDPEGRFKQLLLYGREYDLVTLQVLTYGLFDMLYVDTFVAIFATYLVDLVVRFLRRELAKKNIAGKTLMDDRLLL